MKIALWRRDQKGSEAAFQLGLPQFLNTCFYWSKQFDVKKRESIQSFHLGRVILSEIYGPRFEVHYAGHGELRRLHKSIDQI
ncbi:hypothetical protein [Pseudoxanthomonas yeongjuensis]|uniref:hypothetical protein n=1 Tax=Pseudoxanthomonas yeongjuensis TaxID=377616 RepID=UPI001B870B12|nr:hypothetical protein [Pseudoxanthomonas yeongjuensis]